MNLEQAAKNIGARVVYRPKEGEMETGVITGNNSNYVFVRYGADSHSKATNARTLEFEFDVS